jgi:hypothetical protein
MQYVIDVEFDDDETLCAEHAGMRFATVVVNMLAGKKEKNSMEYAAMVGLDNILSRMDDACINEEWNASGCDECDEAIGNSDDEEDDENGEGE